MAARKPPKADTRARVAKPRARPSAALAEPPARHQLSPEESARQTSLLNKRDEADRARRDAALAIAEAREREDFRAAREAVASGAIAYERLGQRYKVVRVHVALAFLRAIVADATHDDLRHLLAHQLEWLLRCDYENGYRTSQRERGLWKMARRLLAAIDDERDGTAKAEGDPRRGEWNATDTRVQGLEDLIAECATAIERAEKYQRRNPVPADLREVASENLSDRAVFIAKFLRDVTTHAFWRKSHFEEWIAPMVDWPLHPSVVPNGWSRAIRAALPKLRSADIDTAPRAARTVLRVLRYSTTEINGLFSGLSDRQKGARVPRSRLPKS